MSEYKIKTNGDHFRIYKKFLWFWVCGETKRDIFGEKYWPIYLSVESAEFRIKHLVQEEAIHRNKNIWKDVKIENN